MKKTISIFYKVYSAIASVWLAFTIFSLSIFSFPGNDDVETSGKVIDIINVEWKGIDDTIAIVETDDGEGKVICTVYNAGLEVGDEVLLEISSGGASGNYLHARIKR